MIPVRVKVYGFLSYRDEAELRFDGASLWMLCGKNGAGKSAIFDAITFSLFNEGRFGGKDVKPYINQDVWNGNLPTGRSRSMGVEFDFDLGSKRYRAKRAVLISPRGALTSSFSVFLVNRDTGECGAQIVGTDKEAGYLDWIRRHLGVNCEAFIASALLRQGDSDRLLSPDSEKRDRVLSQLIDLSDYKQFHAVVKATRTRWENQRDNLQARLNSLKDRIISMAKAAIRKFDLSEAEFPLEDRWLNSVQCLVQRLKKIEQEENQKTARLQDLENSLTCLKTLIEVWKDNQIQKSAFSWDRTAYNAIQPREEDIERGAAQLLELKETIPARQKWAGARMKWREAQKRYQNAVKEIERLTARLKELEVALPAAQQAWEKAKKALEAAIETLTRAEGERDALKQRLADLQHAQGKPVCQVCGKELTEAQRQEQLQKVAAELRQAEERVKMARANKKVAQDAEQQACDAVEGINTEQGSVMSAIEREKGKQATASAERQNAEDRGQNALDNLQNTFTRCFQWTVAGKPYAPENICARLLDGKTLADALAEGIYPTEADMDAARQKLTGLKGADREKANLDKAKEEVKEIDNSLTLLNDRIEADEQQIHSAVDAPEYEEVYDSIFETLARAKTDIEEKIQGFSDLAKEEDPVKRQQHGEKALQAIRETAEKPAMICEEHCCLIKEARKQSRERATEARDAHRDLSNLIDEYENVHHQWEEAAQYARLHNTLAAKLDKKGLQSWLRVQAERQIVQNADVILRRLSNGKLTVSLEEGSNLALDLRITDYEKRARGLSPRALSGSQKFRLSVSLALGIGQYACDRNESGIQSVIIDEGFGGLDKDGREQMITQLQNLGKIESEDREKRLKRIIVVSHQEEFETAFANRWRIVVEEGTAKASLEMV